MKDIAAMDTAKSSRNGSTDREADDDELDFSNPDLKAELDRRSADRVGEVAWEDLRVEHEK